MRREDKEQGDVWFRSDYWHLTDFFMNSMFVSVFHLNSQWRKSESLTAKIKRCGQTAAGQTMWVTSVQTNTRSAWNKMLWFDFILKFPHSVLHQRTDGVWALSYPETGRRDRTQVSSRIHTFTCQSKWWHMMDFYCFYIKLTNFRGQMCTLNILT